MDFKNKTDPDSKIESSDLTLRIKSREFVRCESCKSNDGKDVDLCSFLEKDAVVTGTWYRNWYSSSMILSDEDKGKVLQKGAIVKGAIDSYDHIIVIFSVKLTHDKTLGI